MHYTKQVIALKAQSRTLQIFDLAQKAKLKSTTMNEDVVFWKWFSDTTLGLVTDTTVYHWDVFDPNQAAPVEVFKRNQNLVVRGLARDVSHMPMLMLFYRGARSSIIVLATMENGWLWLA